LNVRVVVLLVVLAIACKDKTTPEAPKVGSASAARDASDPARMPAVSNTPPVKSTPLTAAKSAQLATRDVDGWTRNVRLADDKGLELRYTTATRPIAITVQIARCFDCLPVLLDKWLPKSDALRALIAPELRDHKDTTWEMGVTELAGTSYIWTHHVAVAPVANVSSTAYTIYFNDGINMIRVVAEYTSDGSATRDALLRAAPKHELEQFANVFVDVFVYLWG